MAKRYTDIPKDSDPTDYFGQERNARGESRWVRGESTVLVYVKGDAGGNGRSDTQAGWGVSYIPPGLTGRFGNLRQETNAYDKSTFRRAEIHAAFVAASHLWRREGYSKVVIATSSEYIFKGINYWILKRRRNGWLTSKKTPVKHRDLWERVWQAIENNDATVQFHLISHDQNKAAPLARRGMVSANNP